MKKRKTLIVIIAAAVLCLGITGTLAIRQVGKSSSISGETARKIACADANVQEADVTIVKSEFGSGNGIYYYTMEFETADVLYRYVINARTGQIVEKAASEPPEKKSSKSKTKKKKKKTAETTVTPAPERSYQPDSAQTEAISVEEARAIALNDAGIPAENAVFSKAMLLNRDGYYIYEIAFFADGRAEYAYTIDALSGEILSRIIETGDGEEPQPTAVPTVRPTPKPTPQPTDVPEEQDSQTTEDSSSESSSEEDTEGSDGTTVPDDQEGSDDPDDQTGPEGDDGTDSPEDTEGEEDPTGEPTAEPSSEPVPSDGPTAEPTSEPVPSDEPTAEPTSEPAPSDLPTVEPSSEPVPSGEPTAEPTSEPVPSDEPTAEPSVEPSSVYGPDAGNIPDSYN